MEAPKIKYKLTQEQIEKFCDIMGFDQAPVIQLNAANCLNTQYIRDLLVRYDFHEFTKGLEYMTAIKKNYSYKEVKIALARAYRTSEADINNIIQGKNNGGDMHFCKKCGKRITGQTNRRTNGLCSECMVDTLGL